MALKISTEIVSMSLYKNSAALSQFIRSIICQFFYSKFGFFRNVNVRQLDLILIHMTIKDYRNYRKTNFKKIHLINSNNGLKLDENSLV
jgi:hypothetical protein